MPWLWNGLMDPRPRVGLSLMLEDDFLATTLPLFEDDSVSVLEWSFDVAWERPMPDWATELLDHYSAEGWLLGHGLHLGALGAAREPRQERWFQRFSRECQERSYRHISEHFGFTTAGDFMRGAPLPMPRCSSALGAGHERLGRLRELSGVPVGLENLALAFRADDALAHGEFLGELLDPVDGFALLDLHNLYCQSVNFGTPMEDLMEAYPIERVREIHLSGGSWSSVGPGRLFRRDTHDHAIPVEVLEVLPIALERFSKVETVIVERLGGTLGDPSESLRFREDYATVCDLVRHRSEVGAPKAPWHPTLDRVMSPSRLEPGAPALEAFQSALLEVLDKALPPDETHAILRSEAVFLPLRDWLQGFDPRALQVASELVLRWGLRTRDYTQ